MTFPVARGSPSLLADGHDERPVVAGNLCALRQSKCSLASSRSSSQHVARILMIISFSLCGKIHFAYLSVACSVCVCVRMRDAMHNNQICGTNERRRFVVGRRASELANRSAILAHWLLRQSISRPPAPRYPRPSELAPSERQTGELHILAPRLSQFARSLHSGVSKLADQSRAHIREQRALSSRQVMRLVPLCRLAAGVE